MKNGSISLCSVLLSALLILYASFFYHQKWKAEHAQNTLGWDVSGYYWYLPSLFVYHDLKQQKFGDSVIDKYGFTPAFEQSFRHESGNRVMTYSSGMAYLYLPFFTIAHLAAKPLGYPADGFSTPYAFMLTVGSALVALLGLWKFRKLLLYHYTDKIVALALLLLVFGTNYLTYSTIDGCLTHNWLFTIYVLLLLNTYHFYQRPSYKHATYIGLLIGLAILTRPTEIIAVIIPLLWGIERLSLKAARERLIFFSSVWKQLLLSVICTFTVASLQSIYWFYVTGKFLVYSYQEKGFSWLHPHFADYIFSYRSGWVTYTPMVLLIFAGIIPYFFNGKNKVAFIAFFAISLYIVCAWDVWWYGGTGGRAMIQSYPVLFFFLAELLKFISDRKILKWICIPIFILCTYFNLWFFYQASSAQGLYQGIMTKDFYWAIFLRWSVPEDTFKLKDTDEIFQGRTKNLKLLYSNNFEADTFVYDASLPPIEGNRSAILSLESPYSPPASFAYSGNAEWIRAQITAACRTSEWTDWKMVQLVVRFTYREKIVKERMIRINRFLKHHQTRAIYFDVKIPSEKFDTVSVFLWNPGTEHYIIADDLKVWSFDEK